MSSARTDYSAGRVRGNDNMLGLSNNATLSVLREAAIAEQQHGRDPATKSQAAAHEAGHIILAYAAGAIVTGARIFEEAGRRAWVGITHHTTPDPTGTVGGKGTGFTTVAAAPVCAFRYAIITAAGLAGEVLAGLDHPASSVDERWMALCICAQLDKALGMPDGTTLHLVGTFTDNVLADHRAQFAAIRAHLERNRRLTRSEATRMLASVKQADLSACLKGGVQ